MSGIVEVCLFVFRFVKISVNTCCDSRIVVVETHTRYYRNHMHETRKQTRLWYVTRYIREAALLFITST